MATARELLNRAEAYRDSKKEQFHSMSFDYEYPMELDLRPDSEISAAIIKMLEHGIMDSRPVTQRLQEHHKRMEHTIHAFMPADEWDTKVKAKDPRRPINIVVPQSFSLKEMYQTYFFYKFLRGGTIHRYRGLSGGADSIVNAALMERVVSKQGAWFDEALVHDMAVGDNFTYGLGVVALEWQKKTMRKPRQTQLGPIEAALLQDQHGLDANEGDNWTDREMQVTKEGTRLRLLDIRQCFFDANVSCNEFQDSEFFGYIYQTNAMQLLKRERDPEEFMFNAKYVRELSRRGQGQSLWWDMSDGRAGEDGSQYNITMPMEETSNRAHVIVWFQEIIPNELFGKGGDEPQWWVFGVAADYVVVHCERLDLDHNMIPAAVTAANANGHETIPISHLMTQSGLQSVADKFINTKINLESTSVNGMIGYDPSKVNEDDMMNPGPGKRVRIRNAAYGEGGIDRYIFQLRSEYDTSHYMADVANVRAIAQEGLGLNQSMLGNLESLPDRPTSQGIQSAQQIGFSRLDMLGARHYTQFLRPIAEMHMYNNVQLLNSDIAVELSGRYEQVLREIYQLPANAQSILVPRDRMSADLDVEPYNKAMSLTRNADGMAEFMKVLAAVPEAMAALLQEYRVSSIFQAWLEEIGFENAAEFKNHGAQTQGPAQVNVVPDEQIQSQMQAGNIVPIGGIHGG